MSFLMQDISRGSVAVRCLQFQTSRLLIHLIDHKLFFIFIVLLFPHLNVEVMVLTDLWKVLGAIT